MHVQTDVERRGIITLDELKLILRATERDGIRPQRLVFDLVRPALAAALACWLV